MKFPSNEPESLPIPAEDTFTPDDEALADDESGQLYEHFRITADKGQQLLRIDKFLFDHLPGTSRNRIQKAAEVGFVHVNDKPVKSNYRVKPFDIVTLMLDRPRYETTIEPEDIPLDIVYEDDSLMVVNKPAGLVVHPGHGNYTGTLVNAIAWHMRNNPAYDPNDPAVGLVHRIDKDTSGLLVIAKTPEAKTSMGRLRRTGRHSRGKHSTQSQRPPADECLSARLWNRKNRRYPLPRNRTLRIRNPSRMPS